MIKKLLFIFLLQMSFATCICAQTREKLIAFRDSIAQQTNKFLTVKSLELKPGLQIEEALKVFESKGWTQKEYNNSSENTHGSILLQGNFFNTPDCEITIFPTINNKDIVGSIVISFPEKDSFKTLKNEYETLKSSLNQKYYINSCTESYGNENIDDTASDIVKLHLLSEGSATFTTKFITSEDPNSILLGYTELQILHYNNDSETKDFVSLMYITSDFIIEKLSAIDDL